MWKYVQIPTKIEFESDSYRQTGLAGSQRAWPVFTGPGQPQVQANRPGRFWNWPGWFYCKQTGPSQFCCTCTGENLPKFVINSSGLQTGRTIYIFQSARGEERNGAIKSCIWRTCPVWEPAWPIPAGSAPPKCRLFVRALNRMNQICFLTILTI